MNFDEMSDERADAMAQAMLASWEQAMDEVHRLRAEVERLRAIEAAARDASIGVKTERCSTYYSVLVTRCCWDQLLAALAAKEEA